MPDQEPRDYVPRKPGVIALVFAAIAIAALCVIAGGLVRCVRGSSAMPGAMRRRLGDDTGHFALETHAAEIAAAIGDFLGPLGSRQASA